MLRDDRSKIPAFLEETLRLESPVKSHFRMARTTTKIGDVEVPAGTTVMVLPGACNRDERKFADPNEFQPDRPQRAGADRLHPRRAFLPGRAAGPRRGPDLAGTDPRPDEATSRSPRSTTAPPRTASYAYEPTFIMRGLSELHITFTPAADRRIDKEHT